jgi:restriction endonuclease S subunit
MGPRCIRIRVDTDRCETFYLLNLLHFYYRDGVFEVLLKGNARRIEIGSLYELQIPLPPLEEQKQITGTLLELSGALVAQEAYVDSILRLREVIV